MGNIIRISEAASLAFHSMLYLAETPETYSSTKEIANAIHGSEHHLAKVVQLLVREGLISTQRGPKGGLKIAKSPENISLMDIYYAIDGEMKADECMMGNEKCRFRRCIFSEIQETALKEIIEYFNNTYLSDYLEE